MNTKAEAGKSGGLDTAKLGASIAILAGAVFAFHYFEDQLLLVRVLGVLVAVGVAAAIALTTTVGRRALGYLTETRNEVRRVVWPSRQETLHTTLLVFGMVLVIGILLWLVDMFMLWMVRTLTGLGS